MKDYSEWSLDTIRKMNLSWMEERRLEWSPLATSALQALLDGKTFLFLSDFDRIWFESYVLSSINHKTSKRPYLPFISLNSFFPDVNNIKTNEDIELLEDMLSIAFPQGHIFFYVGTSNDIKFQIAQRKDDSFIWIFDEKIQNSFFLSSNDKRLDIKLIELLKLFDKSIDAVLHSEVCLEDE